VRKLIGKPLPDEVILLPLQVTNFTCRGKAVWLINQLNSSAIISKMQSRIDKIKIF
jgi:hypothetical protein